MDLRRLRAQEWVAGVLGAALIASTFLDWYGAGDTKRSAWEAFGALDVLLALTGLMGLGVAVAAAAQRVQAISLAVGALLVLVGSVASLWLAVRVASPPGGSGTAREPGAWIGLVACVATTLTALASIRDQSFPRSVADAARVDIATLPPPPRGGAGEAGS